MEVAKPKTAEAERLTVEAGLELLREIAPHLSVVEKAIVESAKPEFEWIHDRIRCAVERRKAKR